MIMELHVGIHLSIPCTKIKGPPFENIFSCEQKGARITLWSISKAKAFAPSDLIFSSENRSRQKRI